MKKIFLALISALLVLCMVACSSKNEEKQSEDVFAADGNQNVYTAETGSFQYELNSEGKCEITKYVPNSVKVVDVVLPKDIDGRDIVGIAADAFKAENSLRSVVIPETYTYVGDYAFYDCDALESVTFEGENIAVIGKGAFEGCDVLSSLTLPGSVESVGNFAFKECVSLTNIDLSGKVKEIGEGAFYGCSALEKISLSNDIEKISKNAFFGCDALEFTVENNACYLGNTENPYLVLVSAVSLNVEECKVNDATKVIANKAFAGCSLLSELTLGNNVRTISPDCIEDCDELNFNEIENGRYLGSVENPYMVLISLSVPSVEDFNLNANTKVLCASAFNNCASLADIHFGGNKADWEAILKDDNWNNGRTVRVLFASEDEEPIIYNK